MKSDFNHMAKKSDETLAVLRLPSAGQSKYV